MIILFNKITCITFYYKYYTVIKKNIMFVKKMNVYSNTKIFDGYSAAFAQLKAKHSHCKYIHRYELIFKVTFIGYLNNNKN